MGRSPMIWLGGACLAAVVSTACVAEAPTPDGPPPTAAPTEPADPSGLVPSDAFQNIVWRVVDAPPGHDGQLYVFLSTGVLIVSSGHGTPLVGSWTAKGGRLATMTEEGATYPIEVLSLDTQRFRFRSLNPGHPVELTLERAAAQ